jgi:hypothetical protein
MLIDFGPLRDFGILSGPRVKMFEDPWYITYEI